jgi:hypothetical protein
MAKKAYTFEKFSGNGSVVLTMEGVAGYELVPTSEESISDYFYFIFETGNKSTHLKYTNKATALLKSLFKTDF